MRSRISLRFRGTDLLRGCGRVPDPATLHEMVTELVEIDHPHVVAYRGMSMILIHRMTKRSGGHDGCGSAWRYLMRLL